jgi:hypothetical protein
MLLTAAYNLRYHFLAVCVVMRFTADFCGAIY